MTAAISKQRKLSLNIDAPLYSMLEKQAEESGVGLNDFIARLLTGMRKKELRAELKRVAAEIDAATDETVAAELWNRYSALLAEEKTLA